MINLDDNYFDTHQTTDFYLSGQVDLAGFFFAVTNKKGILKVLKEQSFKKAIHSYDDWSKELMTFFQKEPLLQRTYASSTWSFFSNKTTLIPNEFAQPGELRTCLEYAVKLDDLDEIHYHALPEYNAVSVFAVPNPPANVVLKYQPTTRFLHQQILQLSCFNHLPGEKKAILHVTPTLVDITLYSGNQLLLSTTYTISSFTDVLYNLALAAKLYDISGQNIIIYYMGLVGEEESNLLRQYYENVQGIYNNATRIQLGKKTAIACHSLLTLAQCE